MHLYCTNRSIVKIFIQTVKLFSAGAISADSTNETSADLYNRFLRENPSPFKGWKEGFVAFAEYVAKSADNCGTLQAYLSDISSGLTDFVEKVGDKFLKAMCRYNATLFRRVCCKRPDQQFYDPCLLWS